VHVAGRDAVTQLKGISAGPLAISSVCVLLAGFMFLAWQTRAIFSDQFKQEYIGLVIEALGRSEASFKAASEAKRSLDGRRISPEAYRSARLDLTNRLTTLAALADASPIAAPRMSREQLSPDASLTETRALLDRAWTYWQDERDRTNADLRMRISRVADALIVLSVLLLAALSTALLMYASRVRQLVDQSEEFEHESLHDELTGLPNRRRLQQLLDAEAARLANEGATGRLAVLYMDLDGFKGINDSLGHRAGDEFLVAVSRCFVQSVRSTDVVSRLGGDEFAVLVRDFAADEQLAAIADRLIACVGETAGQLRVGPVSASIGIATFPGSVRDCHRLVDAADETMYLAKRSGKSRYAFAAPSQPVEPRFGRV
jgi:diguanylate cyclase (GGDEF)-like protein